MLINKLRSIFNLELNLAYQYWGKGKKENQRKRSNTKNEKFKIDLTIESTSHEKNNRIKFVQ